jgi:hypothetical protein
MAKNNHKDKPVNIEALVSELGTLSIKDNPAGVALLCENLEKLRSTKGTPFYGLPNLNLGPTYAEIAIAYANRADLAKPDSTEARGYSQLQKFYAKKSGHFKK